MNIERTPEEWQLIRELVSRGVAHLGAELAQVGLPKAEGAARLLAAAINFESSVQKADE